MYRKGERTPRQIRRDFPHVVEIEIPGSGLRRRVAVIHRWLDTNAGKDNYAFTRRHERATIREWLQVRFKDPALADAFGRAFISGD
jgi:hypothetical protein